MRMWLRTGLLVVGLAGALLGVWWSLKGFGVVPQGFMANHMQWGWRGLVLIAMGGALVIVSRRV